MKLKGLACVMCCVLLMNAVDGKAGNGLPWADIPVSKKPCVSDICQQFKDMCHHGGRCVVTSDCGARCICSNGYTGVVCDKKDKVIVAKETVLLQTIKRSTAAVVKTAKNKVLLHAKDNNILTNSKTTAGIPKISTAGNEQLGNSSQTLSSAPNSTVPEQVRSSTTAHPASDTNNRSKKTETTNLISSFTRTTESEARINTFLTKLVISTTTGPVQSSNSALIDTVTNNISSTTSASQERKSTIRAMIKKMLRSLVAAITVPKSDSAHATSIRNDSVSSQAGSGSV